MRIVPPTAHGVIDYATVLLFLAAPNLFGLAGTAAVISYGLAAIHLAMTMGVALFVVWLLTEYRET